MCLCSTCPGYITAKLYLLFWVLYSVAESETYEFVLWVYASEGSVPCSVPRLIVSSTEWIIMLFPGLTKLVPKYAGERGQQSVIACNLCFSNILSLFRTLLYTAKFSGLTAEYEYNNMWCPGIWWSQNNVMAVMILYSWTVQGLIPGGGKWSFSPPKFI
jgi:hypothetical protein